MNTLTRTELTREVSAPISDDDYGVQTKRGPYPDYSRPDVQAPEYLPIGGWMPRVRELERRVRLLELENEQLRAQIRKLEVGR